jgi:zinc D-Ala-D-Ala carboxypeptidase
MKNFSESEFKCSCGCGAGFKEMNPDFIAQLDLAREYAGVPFKINSSIRCKKHNKDVGGKDTSSHLYGLAVDLDCSNDETRYQIITGCMQAGIKRFGISKSFIHIDDDSTKNRKRVWVY